MRADYTRSVLPNRATGRFGESESNKVITRMYGLIHVALNEMIVKHHGDSLWQRILEQAGVGPEAFMRMRSYDDRITYALVGATAEVLGAPAEDCLKAFGEFWMAEFAPDSYEGLLQAAGGELFTFLENLDLLHDRISTTFVDFVPPSFGVQRLSDTRAILNYVSARNGLVPFVVGLLAGMQHRFGVEIHIQKIEMLDCDSGDKAKLHIEIARR